MTSFNIELNNKPRKDGQYLLLLRLTKNRIHKRISLNRYISLKEFNPHAKYGCWARTSCYQHKEINELIKSKISELQARETELLKRNPTSTIAQLLADNSLKQNISFVEFAKKEIIRHRTHGQFRTSVKKRNLISKLTSFQGDENILFEAITVTFLRAYESYWTGMGNKVNTVQTDFKGIRSIIKSAILEGLISQDLNPFNRLRIKTEKTFRDKLDEMEIRALVNLILIPGGCEWHSRNMFILSYYCAGIRFGDLLQLKWENIQDNHLSYVMDKTGDPIVILLIKESQTILNQYNSIGQKPGDYIFPFFKSNIDYSDKEFLTAQISSKNALINKNLKKIAVKAGISKRVSFHISRHSFAYMALRKSGDVYGVSKSLNHKRLSTTEMYLKDYDVDASDTLLRKVFNN